MTLKLRLLVIDDSESDASHVASALVRAGFDVSYERVDSSETLVDALRRGRFDVAIADYTLERLSGATALRLLREHEADLPFLFVSGVAGEDAAVAGMKSGAHDYLRKGNLKRLIPAVRRELRDGPGRRARRRAEQRLAHLAYHDGLTDLPNRTLLHDRLSQAIRLAHRDQAALALLVLDLDGFKAINDTYGHHAGDRVLRHVAASVRAMLREADTVARLGGDEFAIVLPSTDVAGAVQAARKVLHEIERPCLYNRRPLAVRASVGIACYPVHARSADTLLQKADVAMYTAKADGVGTSVYEHRRDRRTNRRVTLVSELRRAIEDRQFVLDYQPMMHLRTGVVTGVEALVRWEHPRHGRLLPDSFMRLMEQTGQIEPLLSLVLDMAVADWRDSGALPLTVSVNLAPRNLQDPDLAVRIGELLDAHQTPPDTLALEITENLVMADPVHALESLERLHAMGVRLVLDDFGTGYSSLSFLRRLPIDVLKIDRAFVFGLGSGQDEVIARAAIELAHTLGLTATAEGVETEAAYARLIDLGCDAAQGTYISAPAPCEATRGWLMRQNLLGLM